MKTVIFFVALGLLSCKDVSSVKTLKLAHGLDQSHPVHKAMVYMAEEVSTLSEGSMRIDIYPSQQLGTERECLELLQIGSLNMTKVSANTLEGFAPSFKVFSLPYLFRDDTHRFAALEGAIGKNMLLETEQFWLRGLCYYDAGSRSFYTKSIPVHKPEDLKGLKIRTMESPTSVRMVNAIGGSATPIAWGELYTALQQGIVDGAENNPPSFYTSRHYEVCKYYSLDEHTAVPDILVISTHVWYDLSAKQQDILQQAVDSSVVYQKRIWREDTELALEKLRQAGVQIIYPDKQPFRDQVQELIASYASDPEIFELIQRIKAVQ